MCTPKAPTESLLNLTKAPQSVIAKRGNSSPYPMTLRAEKLERKILLAFGVEKMFRTWAGFGLLSKVLPLVRYLTVR